MGRLLFLLIAVALVIIVFEIVQFSWRINLGKEITKRSKAFAVTNPTAHIRILIAGDSTAVGTGSQSPQESIAGRLAKDYPQVEIKNLGMNGLRTKELLEILKKETGSYDVVLLQIGGNDILRFTPLPQLEQGIALVVDRAKEMGRIVILTNVGDVGRAPLFPRPLGLIYTYRSRQVYRLFSQITTTKGIIYVDQWTDKDKDPFWQDPRKHYCADMLHPSGVGYGVWYRKIFETMRQNHLLE